MIRFGNGRLTLLADAIARLSVVLFERTAEGVTYRRTHDLRLERERLSIFALTWTVMHVIDEKSPLFGYTRQRLAETDARLFLAVEARDPAMSTTVYDMKDYNADHILLGMRYQDVITRDEQGRPHADLTRLSLVESEDPNAAPAPDDSSGNGEPA